MVALRPITSALMHVKIFLSTVSDEFGVYRDRVRSDLNRPNVEVTIQEDFENLGNKTLDKLDAYIAQCDAVVHLVGVMTGSEPSETELRALLRKYPALGESLPELGAALAAGEPITYTQWEAWLCAYHEKILIVAVAAKTAKRGPNYAPTEAAQLRQARHLARLKGSGLWPNPQTFDTPEDLANQVRKTAILDLLAKAQAGAPARQPRNLPFTSLGSLFKGREKIMAELRAALQGHRAAAVAGKALHGLGGVGKTRLAIEYAWRHEPDYCALLFLAADTPEKLNASLAALAGPDILDLPERDAPQDSVKIPATLKWLDEHRGWLMILDNVDDASAAEATEALVARLSGGHVLITGRYPHFSGGVETLELDALALEDAVNFLLERSKKRAKTPDDEKLARELANELGCLALGLSQAAAYIDTQRISFARYLELWRKTREKVLNWFDPRLVSYNHDVGLAATWATSVEKLTAQGLWLLRLCAFLDPAPIPKSFVEALPDLSADDALAHLYSYSLATPATIEAGKMQADGFAVHRLVQDFARRMMGEEERREALQAALDWVGAAFVGEPWDVRSWSILDPLAPHARAVATLGDEAQITAPTVQLINELGLLLACKARHCEAEPLYRRALVIFEASNGPDHPVVAHILNNLANSLQATNRIAEAEPLYRRVVAILGNQEGGPFPNFGTALNNLAELLRATNRLSEAEPLFRRALAIYEACYGPDHPNVAFPLNNLANLLLAANRLTEAEPLYRRALVIREACYGPDHPLVANILNDLAALLRNTKRPMEAETLHRRALAIDEASYGPDHPNVAIRLNNLALLLKETNRLSEAEPLFRRALAIDEACYGPDHPLAAIRLNNLANLLGVTNRISEAKLLSCRHLEILLAFTAQTGHQHPELRLGLNNYFQILLEAGGEEAHAHAEIDALLEKYGVALDQENQDDPPPRNPGDPATWGQVKRNEPCPCGSGKRYKHCHGALV
jgi:tetratricopeptide (TPR) repeat protein